MKKFLITIDTEADNQWDVSKGISTENSVYLPRFQNLCERYGFIPTWLTNYEMARDRRFVSSMKRKNDRGLCEIGMHPHAWNNPPEYHLKSSTDQRPYLIEYPDEIMQSKIEHLMSALESSFEAPITSHRSGRWALDSRYISILASKGIVADCSVTPHVSWEKACGITGAPGSDYSSAPEEPYILQPNLIEIPVTIRRMRYFAWDAIYEPKDVLRQGKRFVKGQWQWLRPARNPSAHALCALVDQIMASESEYAMLMIHSSELMPGGSPSFPDERSIERLYEVLEKLFFHIAECGYEGMGLTAFAQERLTRVS